MGSLLSATYRQACADEHTGINGEGLRSSECRSKRVRQGFTLIELMVVIAVILILLLLATPSVYTALGMAKRVLCASQMRNLTGAWMNYSADNNWQLVGGSTFGSRDWVLNGNTLQAIENGRLYPYVGDFRQYRCPDARQHYYYRNYSLSCALNAEGRRAERLTQITRPSRTIVFVEDMDRRGYLVGSFFLSNDRVWTDYMAANHQGGDNFAFADGHVAYWKYQDKRTMEIFSHETSQPNNPDLQRIWRHIWPPLHQW